MIILPRPLPVPAWHCHYCHHWQTGKWWPGTTQQISAVYCYFAMFRNFFIALDCKVKILFTVKHYAKYLISWPFLACSEAIHTNCLSFCSHSLWLVINICLKFVCIKSKVLGLNFLHCFYVQTIWIVSWYLLVVSQVSYHIRKLTTLLRS